MSGIAAEFVKGAPERKKIHLFYNTQSKNLALQARSELERNDSGIVFSAESGTDIAHHAGFVLQASQIASTTYLGINFVFGFTEKPLDEGDEKQPCPSCGNNRHAGSSCAKKNSVSHGQPNLQTSCRHRAGKSDDRRDCFRRNRLGVLLDVSCGPDATRLGQPCSILSEAVLSANNDWLAAAKRTSGSKSARLTIALRPNSWTRLRFRKRPPLQHSTIREPRPVMSFSRRPTTGCTNRLWKSRVGLSPIHIPMSPLYHKAPLC